MKLYAVRIFVDDWNAACEFYDEVLGLPLKFKNDEIGWVEFECFHITCAAYVDRTVDVVVEGRNKSPGPSFLCHDHSSLNLGRPALMTCCSEIRYDIQW